MDGEREGGKLESDDWRCVLVAAGAMVVEEEGGGGLATCTEAMVEGARRALMRSGAGVTVGGGD